MTPNLVIAQNSSANYFTPFDRLVTLAVYDSLRFISRTTRRYADRLARMVDIDALRGFHGFPPADSFVDTSYDYLGPWNNDGPAASGFNPDGEVDESDMERARR